MRAIVKKIVNAWLAGHDGLGRIAMFRQLSGLGQVMRPAGSGSA
jgi:hypothetical protein